MYVDQLTALANRVSERSRVSERLHSFLKADREPSTRCQQDHSARDLAFALMAESDYADMDARR